MTEGDDRLVDGVDVVSGSEVSSDEIELQLRGPSFALHHEPRDHDSFID